MILKKIPAPTSIKSGPNRPRRGFARCHWALRPQKSIGGRWPCPILAPKIQDVDGGDDAIQVENRHGLAFKPPGMGPDLAIKNPHLSPQERDGDWETLNGDAFAPLRNIYPLTPFV